MTSPPGGDIAWCVDCEAPSTVADEGVEEDNWGALFWGITFECGHTEALPWCRSCRGYHALGGEHYDVDFDEEWRR